jgi:hypothetical protein
MHAKHHGMQKKDATQAKEGHLHTTCCDSEVIGGSHDRGLFITVSAILRDTAVPQSSPPPHPLLTILPPLSSSAQSPRPPRLLKVNATLGPKFDRINGFRPALNSATLH